MPRPASTTSATTIGMIASLVDVSGVVGATDGAPVRTADGNAIEGATDVGVLALGAGDPGIDPWAPEVNEVVP